jgi:hypothetical protein
MIPRCPGGEIGRRARLKILWFTNTVRVRFPPWAHKQKLRTFVLSFCLHVISWRDNRKPERRKERGGVANANV